MANIAFIRFIKQSWNLVGAFAGKAIVVSTIVGAIVKGTMIWDKDHQELSHVSVMEKKLTELTTTVNSVHRELKSVNTKVDIYGKQTEKTGIVVTDLAGKVFTKDEFNRYYKPTLNFNYPDTSKKKEIQYLNICTLSPDTCAFILLSNLANTK